MSTNIFKVNSRKQINYSCLDKYVDDYHKFAEFCCDMFSDGSNEDGSIEYFYLPDKDSIELQFKDKTIRKKMVDAVLVFAKKNGYDTMYGVSW